MISLIKRIPPVFQVLVISGLVLIIDLILAPVADASVLIALLFWAGIGQGIIALAAAADLSGGKWIAPIRPYLHQYYPLLLMFPLVFLVYARHVSVYHWFDQGNGWLNPLFFILRNAVVLLLPVIFAHFYIRGVNNQSPRRCTHAVLYLVSFVTAQSFLAFDLVMTFEYPWINTLFGGYFFVESFYGGVAFCAILAGVLMRRRSQDFQGAYRDFTLMIMGFALLWAGLFYSQYLVIWYGNIPEEVSYVSRRLAIPLVKNMGIYILIALFIIPFIALVSRKIKSIVTAVSLIALVVFSGLMVERLIYIYPVAYLNPFVVVLHTILLGLPFMALLYSQVRSQR